MKHPFAIRNMLSFSAAVKEDLSALFVKKICCKKAPLLGILRPSYLFSEREIHFVTRSRAAVQLAKSLLWDVFSIDVSPSGLEDTLSEGNYSLTLTDDDAKSISSGFEPGPHAYASVPSMLSAPCAQDVAMYLRGVFLSCGTVTDPTAAYQLEWVLSEEDMAVGFGELLSSLGIHPKHTARKGMPILYLKDSAAIEDLLTIIGAQKAVFSLMNTKIEKEIRNTANRISNCELANIEKTISASGAQYEAIRTLYAENRFTLLPTELQTTARLRYEHPDLSLKELAALHEPPLTKSGLNHRLAKIMTFAEKNGK